MLGLEPLFEITTSFVCISFSTDVKLTKMAPLLMYQTKTITMILKHHHFICKPDK